MEQPNDAIGQFFSQDEASPEQITPCIELAKDTAPLWNGVPEVVCVGSSYEVGFAHGSQIPRRIATCIEIYAKLYRELLDINWAEAKRRAAAFILPLAKSSPDILEEMRGIADGAKVDHLDILALNIRSELALTNYTDGCTSIATTAGEEGGLPIMLLAQNWDWITEVGNIQVFLDIRKTGKPRIRFLGEAGLVGKYGMNDAGLGVCANAIRSGLINVNMLPVHVAVRRSLECTSFEEAEKMLATEGVAACVNIVIADKSGRFASIECSPKGNKSIHPDLGSKTVCHTNHLYALEDALDHPAENSFTRLARIKELSKSEDHVSVDKIRQWLSDEQNKPMSICRSRPLNVKGIERMETIATVIMDIKNFKVEVSLGRPSLSPPIRTLQLK